MNAPVVGDQWLVPCHLAEGQEVTDTTVVAIVTVTDVVRLGCSCWRLYVARPGADVDAWCGQMQVRTGCAWHTAGGRPVDGQ